MSDPWDFVTDNGESRTGIIVAEEMAGGTLPVLRIGLDHGITAQAICADTVFASFRHAGDGTLQLLSGQPVPCAFATHKTGSDLSADEKSIAFIGSLQLSGHAA